VPVGEVKLSATVAPSNLIGIMISLPDHNDISPAYTDETGKFVMPTLPPATYTLKIQHTGFEPTIVKGVNVAPNSEANIGKVELQQRRDR
jgi:hypothetical protein